MTPRWLRWAVVAVAIAALAIAYLRVPEIEPTRPWLTCEDRREWNRG